ncbi:hypothetical protein [Candidatus Jidaibacter acanthamoebae]|nr:hypothetical protein [Candidatus Jidaibacter acanthamoeba]
MNEHKNDDSGEYQEIQELLNKAIELRSDDLKLKYERSQKVIIAEPLQQLLNTQESIVVAPHLLAYYLLIRLHTMHGKVAEAKKILKKFEEINLSFKKTKNLSPQQQEEKVLVLYLTAYAYSDIGDKNCATELLKKIEKLNQCKQALDK